MPYRGDMDADTWLGLGLSFYMHFVQVAAADGCIDEAEQERFRQLFAGELAGHCLPEDVHARLGSSAGLARELLAYVDAADRRALIEFVRDNEYDDVPARVATADQALRRWSDAAASDDERAARAAEARGLRYEAFHFGVRTALASGPRQGVQMSLQERGRLSWMAAAFDIELEAVDAIFVAADAFA